MIVVDVNALVYLWIPGEKTALAERALRRDPRWVAPILWKSEFRNVLCGCVRRGAMPMDGALRCMAGVEEQMREGGFVVPSASVLREAVRSECSAYDCEYAALAVDLGVKLVTCDRQILKHFPGRAVDLGAFADGS